MYNFFQVVSLVPLLSLSPLELSVDWYCGNTKAHRELSWYRDSSTEHVTKWHHDHGYNFLILSENNRFIDSQSVELPENARSDFLLIPEEER